MVHKNAAGGIAVIAVFFKQGKENAALKDVFAGMPAKEVDILLHLALAAPLAREGRGFLLSFPRDLRGVSSAGSCC